MKRLYKSRDNRVLAGILGGLGEYFNVDPVLLRLGYIFMVAFTAFVPGIIAYVVAVFVVPEKPAVP